MPISFDYAIVRIVPLTEREEFFNAGVILFCPQRAYLDARVYLDPQKLAAFGPDLNYGEVQQRLEAIIRICAGDPAGGPIAHLSQRARFHWLVSPRSTLIQVSAVHSGICEEPGPVIDKLLREHVTPP